MKKNHTLLCEIYAILGYSCWGFSNLFLTIAQRHADTKVILSSRFLFAFLLMNLILLSGKQKISLKGKPVLPLVILVLTEPISFYLESYGVLYSGVTLTSITIAIIPILTILAGAAFLKEYPAKKQLYACVLPMFGVSLCALASGHLQGGNAFGLILLIGNALVLTAFRVMNRKASATWTSFERTYFLLLVCAAVFTTHTLIQNHGNIGVYIDAWSQFGFALPVMMLGAFSSVIANILINYATAHISLAKTSAFSNLTTVVATFCGIVILREHVTTGMIFGMILIVIGVMLVNRFDGADESVVKKTYSYRYSKEIA